MNNQVKLIDAEKLLEWMSKQYIGFTEKFEEQLKAKISIGDFDPITPPVPTIGCSECEYKGYFEYETGVVDEGTRIKEIAKEPCDCVIDRVPTIKPGDKGLFTFYLNDRAYGKGSSEYMAELFNDYIVTDDLYGLERVDVRIERR